MFFVSNRRGGQLPVWFIESGLFFSADLLEATFHL